MLRLRRILSFLPCEMAAKAMQAERTGCALAGSAGFCTGHVPNWLLAALESQVPNSSLLSSRRGVLRCGRSPLVALVLLWGGVPFFLGGSWKIKKNNSLEEERPVGPQQTSDESSNLHSPELHPTSLQRLWRRKGTISLSC